MRLWLRTSVDDILGYIVHLSPEEEMKMVKEQLKYQDRIIQDPKIVVGKPVVKGTRIPVELVLAKLAHNPDLDELFVAYPELTKDDVRAVLAYAQARMEDRQPARGPRSPEQFYKPLTKRSDVREILDQ